MQHCITYLTLSLRFWYYTDTIHRFNKHANCFLVWRKCECVKSQWRTFICKYIHTPSTIRDTLSILSKHLDFCSYVRRRFVKCEYNIFEIVMKRKERMNVFALKCSSIALLTLTSPSVYRISVESKTYRERQFLRYLLARLHYFWTYLKCHTLFKC